VSRTAPDWRLVELDPPAFAALAVGEAPAGLALPPSSLGPPEVLAMLARIAAEVAAVFEPGAWMIVDGKIIAGLLSQTAAPRDGVLTIGYGVAPSEQSRGAATAAVAALCAWASGDERVTAIFAETATGNPASQRVLAANGFAVTGRRIDAEDGELLCWRWSAG